MAEQAKKGKKRTSFLTMLVIAILIALVGVQLIHLRSQIDDARSQLTALQSDLDTAKQENDALASALEKADDLVRVMRRFFSGGLEFSFFTTIIRSSFFGSFTMAASMTLKSGLKNILVFEKVWKSFVVT